MLRQDHLMKQSYSHRWFSTGIRQSRAVDTFLPSKLAESVREYNWHFRPDYNRPGGYDMRSPAVHFSVRLATHHFNHVLDQLSPWSGVV